MKKKIIEELMLQRIYFENVWRFFIRSFQFNLEVFRMLTICRIISSSKMGQHYLNILFNEQSGPESVSPTKCQITTIKIIQLVFEVRSNSIKLEEN